MKKIILSIFLISISMFADIVDISKTDVSDYKVLKDYRYICKNSNNEEILNVIVSISINSMRHFKYYDSSWNRYRYGDDNENFSCYFYTIN